MAPGKVSHFITTTVLGIDVGDRHAQQPADLGKRAYEVLEPAGIYLEEEPTVGEWIKQFRPSTDGTIHYMTSLFPCASWIRRYRGAWLLGDLLAGITIGLVVVPQAMAYALLAQLTPAYGLYTSFTGAVLYWLFGTSKDIVIGTTAVGSLLVGQVVSRVDQHAPGEYSHQQTAHALSLMSGAVLLFFGLFRLGWIIEFIPYIPISAFVTAASINIMCTQIPTALGIHGVDTRDAPYLVLINTFKALPTIRVDAAIGLASLTLLFAIRGVCERMELRNPAQKRMWSFISSIRLTFVMLLFTLISFLVNRNLPLEDSKFRIVGHIEPGFRQANVPSPDARLLGIILPELPAIAIILVIEHIAIAKAMGRRHNYTINPSQEIVALGTANMFSPFVGGYVCTGSFGASAVLSKAGVRTPLAGLFSAGVLVLALYVLTGVFYYIPNAALAGLIIHAVCNLVAPPRSLQKYWQLSPLELVIWVVCVILALFTSLETAIYTGIGLSFALLLFRVARTGGQFLGRARVRRVIGEKDGSVTGKGPSDASLKYGQDPMRDVFLPLDRKDASNPNVMVESPYPGVFVYRFNESYNYTNQAHHVQILRAHIVHNTKRMAEEYYEKESDRLWNDPGPRVYHCDPNELPHLRAVVFDFAAVNNLDITSVQGLLDLRDSFNRYCAPDTVEMHFANVHNRWTRRGLAAAGFGYPTAKDSEAVKAWKPTFSIGAVGLDGNEQQPLEDKRGPLIDVESSGDVGSKEPVAAGMTWVEDVAGSSAASTASTPKMAALYGVDRPFFHVDLHDAVDSAVRGAQSKDEKLRGLEGI